MRSHFEPDSELDGNAVAQHPRAHQRQMVAQFPSSDGRSDISQTESEETAIDSEDDAYRPRDQSQGRPPSQSQKKMSKAQRYLPKVVYQHGRTMYGGNPIVQQTLPGYFLHPSPFVMIPLFFVLMLPFVIVGALILVDGRRRYEVDVPYSQIHQYQYIPTDPSVNVNQGLRQFTVASEGSTSSQGTVTWVSFTIEKKLKAPVFFYYKLGNYFQNFREFHDGRNINQLVGKKKIGSTNLCRPYSTVGYLHDEGDNLTISYTHPTSGETVTRRAKDMTYNPCGTAPWALFNDTLHLYRVVNVSGSDWMPSNGTVEAVCGPLGDTPLETVCKGSAFTILGEPTIDTPPTQVCRKKGISWKADTDIRFHNMTIRDDWWSLYYPYTTDNDYLNNGWYLHEPGHALPDPKDLDLQVWMRASVRSTFRKLYRVIETDLLPGPYMMKIEEFYDVTSFGGEKSFVLRDDSWVGQENTVMGVIFIVIGCLCFVLGVAFAIELCLQRRGLDRLSTLPEPKRTWYYFNPRRTEFESYFSLRTERYVPMEELRALRKAQGVDCSDD